MPNNDLEIRPLRTHQELQTVEQLQMDVWQMDSAHDLIPAHLMTTFQQNGGLILGAFSDGKLVGFSLGFVGLTKDGRPKLCSEMLGVLPAYRDQKVGTQLKLAQRRHALAQGFELITWTYDPLETRNANLNLHKLGAVCNTYFVNLYGEVTGINAGLPTDRFQVDWFLNSRHVQQRLAGQSLQSIGTLRAANTPLLEALAPERLPIPPRRIYWSDEESLLVEVPADFQQIKATDMMLAQQWRQYTRELFTAVFRQEYLLTDLLFEDDRAFYYLQKGVTIS